MIGVRLPLMAMKVSGTTTAAVLTMLLAATAGAAADDTEVTQLAGHLIDDSGERQPLQTIVPMYPERARRERLEGVVQVCFNVDRSGRTSRVSVRKSTNRVFEKPSTLAVRASSYRPLAEGKELSGIKTCRTFRFQLTPVAIESPD